MPLYHTQNKKLTAWFQLNIPIKTAEMLFFVLSQQRYRIKQVTLAVIMIKVEIVGEADAAGCRILHSFWISLKAALTPENCLFTFLLLILL
jgi:hypothetical protein